MTGTTAGELWARRTELETAAAQVLGNMQFEFSRLDMALGLCAVWVEGGQRLEDLNPQVSSMTFHKRLEFVDVAVEKRHVAKSKAYVAYKAWIARAHIARTTRNELVHGRWGVEPATYQVVNVLGLPTSSEQREVKYTLAELAELLQELRILQRDLYRLREQWPL
jgi:hypothetical protein